MKESKELFSLKENEQISRSELFHRYIKLLKENPTREKEILTAYQTLLGGNIVTYPPIRAKDLIKNAKGIDDIEIPNWFSNIQAVKEKINNLMNIINKLFKKDILNIEDIEVLFYLNRNLELEIESITNPILREEYINYLKAIDQHLKNSYILIDRDKVMIQNIKGSKKQ